MSNDVPEERAGAGDAPSDARADEAEGGADRASAHLGRSPADSATTDEPEGEHTEDEIEYTELAKVFNAPDRGTAKLVKAIFEEAQIPSVIEDDASDTLDGIVGAQLDGIDVFVPAEFAERARALLDEAGIAGRFDRREMQAFFEQEVVPALRAGAGAPPRALAEKLGEKGREFRHAVITALGREGAQGAQLARALLGEAVRLEENPLVVDVPSLADAGHLGREAPLQVLDDLARLAADPAAPVRREVARALGFMRRAGAGATLVTLLGDRDAAVRDEALESLYSLSGGETFDFDPDVDPAKQQAAIVRWREWVRDNPGV
jgi:hypothetical protein